VDVSTTAPVWDALEKLEFVVSTASVVANMVPHVSRAAVVVPSLIVRTIQSVTSKLRLVGWWYLRPYPAIRMYPSP
jgi:hypothetical protein